MAGLRHPGKNVRVGEDWTGVDAFPAVVSWCDSRPIAWPLLAVRSHQFLSSIVVLAVPCFQADHQPIYHGFALGRAGQLLSGKSPGHTETY
jgi:hypothetical protein